jgi:hypothetical protein
MEARRSLEAGGALDSKLSAGICVNVVEDAGVGDNYLAVLQLRRIFDPAVEDERRIERHGSQIARQPIAAWGR